MIILRATALKQKRKEKKKKRKEKDNVSKHLYQSEAFKQSFCCHVLLFVYLQMMIIIIILESSANVFSFCFMWR